MLILNTKNPDVKGIGKKEIKIYSQIVNLISIKSP